MVVALVKPTGKAWTNAGTKSALRLRVMTRDES